MTAAQDIARDIEEACLCAALLLDPPLGRADDIAPAAALLHRLRPKLMAIWPDPAANLAFGIDPAI